MNENIKCQFIREAVIIDLIFSSEDEDSNVKKKNDKVNNSGIETDPDLNALTELKLSLHLEIIPTPNRFNRLLFDTHHNLYYPWDGYIPKDNIANNQYSYNYDWTAETLDTNYFNVFKS